MSRDPREENELIRARRRKLEALRAQGIDPYARRYPVTHATREIIERYGGMSREELEGVAERFSVAGRIMALRTFGKAAFAHIQDAQGRIQIYARMDLLGEERYRLLDSLDLGDWIGVQGRLFRTRTHELTLEVSDWTLLSKSLRPLPEKWHGLTDVEVRYRQRYLDLLVNPKTRWIFRTRSRLIRALRQFLDHQGFLEVETPMMHPIPGGAAARPFVTHHNALGVDLYLRIAPELYLKRLVVGGFERVYEINRNFRNEGISSVHNPEFTMLEFYVAYWDYRDLMTFTETLFQHLAQEVLGRTRFPFRGQEIDLASPWRRLTVEEALREAGGVPEAALKDREAALDWAREQGISLEGAESLDRILVTLFDKRVAPHLTQPTFVTDYPTEVSPLARRRPDNPDRVERFEVFIGGLEVANAFTELIDPLDQRSRFEEQEARRRGGDEEAQCLDEDFLRALEQGMPPTAGEGIGIDRLVMLFTDSPSIREVILFPQLRPEH